jgi:hypothetical protein
MTLRPHSLRLEVAAIQQQFHILCASPLRVYPTDDFVLQRVLNRDGVNKLSQLSISVSFTLWAISLKFVPVYVAQTFCIINRTCLPCSSVQHSVQK